MTREIVNHLRIIFASAEFLRQRRALIAHLVACRNATREDAAVAFARGHYYERLPDPRRSAPDMLRFDTGRSSYDVHRCEVKR